MKDFREQPLPHLSPFDDSTRHTTPFIPALDRILLIDRFQSKMEVKDGLKEETRAII
jgi:hypothetical protein